MNHFFLNKGILVKLTNMFPRVNFISTCLGNWNNKASSQTATHQHCHDAKVKNHGAMCIHMLWTRNSIFRLSWWWPLCLGRCLRINFNIWIKLDELHWSTHLLSQSMSSWLDYLGESGDSIFNAGFDLVQFVPEVFLYYAHVFPSVHSVCFNVTNFILIFGLLAFITVNINL